MGSILFGLHWSFQKLAAFIRWTAPVWPWVAIMALGAVLYHCTPLVGPRAVQASLRADLVSAQESAASWEMTAAENRLALELSQSLRRSEARQAVTSLAEQSAQCRIDIAEARRSAVIIEKLIGDLEDEGSTSSGGRRLIDADGLRDALKARP